MKLHFENRGQKKAEGDRGGSIGKAARARADRIMQENSRYVAELTKAETLEAIRKHQRAAKKNSLYREMDWAVQRAYYGDNGVRFYGELLLEYVRNILPRETETERMWIGGYNSCIAHMRWKWEDAEAKCAQWERQLVDVEEAFSQDEAARRSVGYENITEAYRAYKTCRQEGKDPHTLQEKLKKMERICAANRTAAETAGRYLGTEPAIAPPEKEALRRALREVLGSGMADRLDNYQEMTAEDYRAALKDYARLVEDALLKKFGGPDKEQTETE